MDRKEALGKQVKYRKWKNPDDERSKNIQK